MKKIIISSLAFCLLSILGPSVAQAENSHNDSGGKIEQRAKLGEEAQRSHAQHPKMQLHDGTGPIADNEYIIIDLTGSITRSSCPYTCEDRGLPNEHCKTWKSIQNPNECYVQDTRIESDAFPSLKN